MQVLHNDFVNVSIDSVTGVVRVVRSDRRIDSALDVEAAWGAVVREFQGLQRRRFRLLVDLRAAAGRNDPEFEDAMRRQRVAMLRGFDRVAVLVRTLLGQLQVERYAREDQTPLRVFVDDVEAEAWIAEWPSR